MRRIKGIKGLNGGYRKLVVYQRIMELVVLVYELTKKLPEDEKFGLVSQMRRAVVSIASNFVEAYLKRSKKEKAYFLETSMTSLLELESQGEVCYRVGYWSKKDFQQLVDKKGEVSYLLGRYTSAVKK